MGSLMAGWDKHFSDPKTVSLERNKSLTKEEIENFWRSRKPSKFQHHQQIVFVGDGQLSKHQISLDWAQFLFQSQKCSIDLEKPCKSNDWWTQSNWAFLNEPPYEEADKAASNYAAQFYVAQLHTNKCTPAN